MTCGVGHLSTKVVFCELGFPELCSHFCKPETGWIAFPCQVRAWNDRPDAVITHHYRPIENRSCFFLLPKIPPKFESNAGVVGFLWITPEKQNLINFLSLNTSPTTKRLYNLITLF
jgi:hypothetical protein